MNTKCTRQLHLRVDGHLGEAGDSLMMKLGEDANRVARSPDSIALHQLSFVRGGEHSHFGVSFAKDRDGGSVW